MKYTLINTANGHYLDKSLHGFTTMIAKAAIFETQEEANAQQALSLCTRVQKLDVPADWRQPKI